MVIVGVGHGVRSSGPSWVVFQCLFGPSVSSSSLSYVLSPEPFILLFSPPNSFKPFLQCPLDACLIVNKLPCGPHPFHRTLTFPHP